MDSAFLVHSSVMEIMTVKMEVMKKTAVKVRLYLILFLLSLHCLFPKEPLAKTVCQVDFAFQIALLKAVRPLLSQIC